MNDMPPALLLDADMVLLDYIGQFERFMRERHGIHAAVPFERETVYDLPHMYPDFKGRELVPYYVELSKDPDYYGSIPALPGALEGIAKLRDLLPDVPFVCVTSGGSHPETRRLRLQNLVAFGLDDIVTLPIGSSKVDVMRTFAPGCWFVDDLPKHVNEANEVGHVGILYSQPYNAAEQGFLRARDWHAVVDIIRTKHVDFEDSRAVVASR